MSTLIFHKNRMNRKTETAQMNGGDLQVGILCPNRIDNEDIRFTGYFTNTLLQDYGDFSIVTNVQVNEVSVFADAFPIDVRKDNLDETMLCCQVNPRGKNFNDKTLNMIKTENPNREKGIKNKIQGNKRLFVKPEVSPSNELGIIIKDTFTLNPNHIRKSDKIKTRSVTRQEIKVDSIRRSTEVNNECVYSLRMNYQPPTRLTYI